MNRKPSSLLPRLRRLLHDSSATTAVEFALVVPFFLTLVFGTITAGVALSAVSQIHYAAERSARCLAVNVSGNCSKATIDTYAKGWYKGPGMTGLAFTSPATDPTCGKQVSGSGNYSFVPGLKAMSFTLSATACYPVI